MSNRVAMAARLFRGLADPTRLGILIGLHSGPMRVVDLCDLTGRAQPNVSAHLAQLRDAGLVTSQSSGRETHYSLATDQMGEVLAAADEIIRLVGPQLCSDEWCPIREARPKGL